MKKESQIRSIIKSLSWRCVAILDTLVVVLLITCYFDQCSLVFAFTIGFLEFFFKSVVYYIHERIWQRIQISNRTQSIRTVYKSISWRVIATIMTYIIAGAIISDSNEIATYIALIEVFSKTILYYIHERLWLILPLGRVRRIAKSIFNVKQHHSI